MKAHANGIDKRLPPSRRVKSNLSNVDASKIMVGNHGDRPTSREVVYEMNREAKELYKKEMKLTNCKFVNVINMSMRLKELDKLERIERGDKTTDLLGFVRDSGFHDGLMALLYAKIDMLVRPNFCLF